MEADFQVVFRDDYEADYHAAMALKGELSGTHTYDTKEIERALKAVEILFQRLGEDPFKDKEVWGLVTLLDPEVLSPKKELQNRLLDLFLKSLAFPKELKEIKLKLIGVGDVSQDLGKELLVCRIAFGAFTRLASELQSEVKWIQHVIPGAISMEGETKRLAEAILPLTEKIRRPFHASTPPMSVPKGPSQPLRIDAAPGTSPEDALREPKLQRLTEVADQLFSEYSQRLFHKVSPQDRDVLLGKIKSHFPALIEKFFVSEPHIMKSHEKEAVLAILKEVRGFVEDLEHVDRSRGMGSKQELLRLHALKIGTDLDHLPKHIMSLLEQIVSRQLGLSGKAYQPIATEIQIATRDCVAGFLFVAIDRVFRPDNVTLFLKRLLEEDLNLNALSEKLSPSESYDKSDTYFSRSAGEYLETILRKLSLILVGKSVFADTVFKFLRRESMGVNIQQQVNAILSSDVSMTPLLFLEHILLYKDADGTHGVLLDKQLPADYNLRKALKTKLRALFNKSSWFVQLFPDKPLDKLVDLIAIYLESKEGLYILISYVLKGYLNYISRSQV